MADERDADATLARDWSAAERGESQRIVRLSAPAVEPPQRGAAGGTRNGA